MRSPAGRLLPKDSTEAVKWFRKASEQGDADAQKELGDMYRSGEGVTKDINEAAKWYHKSAEQGNGDAQYILGSLYSKGDGVLKDSTEALKWYLKSASREMRSRSATSALPPLTHRFPKDWLRR